MQTLIHELFASQTTLLQQPSESPLRRTTLLRLVNTVPAPVLAHFLRMVEQGRPGVAIVRHGVCSGCHLRLPFGQAAALLQADNFHLCENCGSYLMLPPEEQPAPPSQPRGTTTAPKRRRQVCAAVPA